MQMSYRRAARISKGAYTKFGGPAVSGMAKAVAESPVVEPEYLSVTVSGTCAGCGVASEDMEGEGWVTPDNYKSYLCPSCQVKGKCQMCGLTLTVQEVHAGSQYVGSFRVGDLIGQCTNPECDDRGYMRKVSIQAVN